MVSKIGKNDGADHTYLKIETEEILDIIINP